jgi:uncharacterized lipoprotein YddW (UPF0748 family)
VPAGPPPAAGPRLLDLVTAEVIAVLAAVLLACSPAHARVLPGPELAAVVAGSEGPGTPAADRSAPVAGADVDGTPAVQAADAAGLLLPAHPVDYLWVLRNSLVRADDIPIVIARAQAMGVKGLLVQVVGRGDAWYRSDRLPAAEALQGSGRDPLAELLPLAHAAGLEVHAWVNCCLVWSSPQRPRDPRHVLNAHPEWVARMADGRPMSRLTARQRARLHVEGIFLSPAHPGVRRWLAGNVKELAARYPLDGIHLDYIRQPGIAIGYDPTSRARFALESGTDPLTFRSRPWAERARLDSAWTAFQQDQVTAIVREVRDSLQSARPGLLLSAAVLADTTEALRGRKQPWVRWLRDGLLDRAFLMCYAPAVPTVLAQLTAISGAQVGARVVPGIAMYNTPLSTAAVKLKAARALGFSSVALYSYDSLYERPGLWERLRAFLTERDPSEVHP